MKIRNMTEGSPLKLMMAVALPLMLGNAFQQLYTVVDAQVVGQVEGYKTLAALGSCDWFSWLFLGLIQGFAQGFTIPMAQAFGAKDDKGLRKCIGNAGVLAVITSVLFAFVALLSIEPIMQVLKVEKELQPIAGRYMQIIFAALPVVMAYNLLAGILRSMGDGKTPLYAMIIASLVNVLLDYLFVKGLGWGVSGAAIATVIAQIFSCAYCLWKLKGLKVVHPSKADFRLDGGMSGRLMLLGVPVAAQNCVIAIGGMIILRVVNPMGAAFIAGYTASNKLYGILEIAAISFGYAVSAYAGQNYGAGKTERIYKGVHAAAVVGVLTACFISAMMFVFGKMIVSSFISGEEAEEVEKGIKIACEYLYTMSACLPILYILYIYRSALQGMGNTMMPLVSGIAEFVMRTGAALILPGIIGYPGVFWAEVLAWFGADVILIPSYYMMIKRMRKKQTKKQAFPV